MQKQAPESLRQAPQAVFTEIFSFIKGSALALETAEGFLSLQQYRELPSKMSAMSAGSSSSQVDLRPRFYELFLRYQRLKKELGAFDAMDLLSHM